MTSSSGKPPNSAREELSLEAEATQRREELGDALVAIAVRMLQNGADAEFVQRWVDSECERMRRVQRKTHGWRHGQ